MTTDDTPCSDFVTGWQRGDCVLRKPFTRHREVFLCHPFSFGQVIEEQIRNGREVVILPFDAKMAPVKENGWIQWAPDEMWKVPGCLYAVLCLAWPLLRRIYPKPLAGQRTCYRGPKITGTEHR